MSEVYIHVFVFSFVFQYLNWIIGIPSANLICFRIDDVMVSKSLAPVGYNSNVGRALLSKSIDDYSFCSGKRILEMLVKLAKVVSRGIIIQEVKSVSVIEV